MPKALHRKLAKKAAAKGLVKGSERWGAYVYGTLNKIDKKKKKK